MRRPDSRWTGSARSRRRPRWSARPGQGAYAAANSWLDAFTHWRRSSGPARQRDRVGGLGRDRARHAPGRGRPDHDDRSRRGRVRVRGAAAPRPRATPATRRPSGTPWLAALVARSPFAEAFQSAGDTAAPEASSCVPNYGRLPRDEWPSQAAAADLRTDQPDPAPRRRPGPRVRRPRAWTRWAIWSCAPASKPRPVSGSLPRPSRPTTPRAL